jgi:hypothetical protein
VNSGQSHNRLTLTILALIGILHAPLAGAKIQQEPDAQQGHREQASIDTKTAKRHSLRDRGVVREAFWKQYPGNRRLYARQTGGETLTREDC